MSVIIVGDRCWILGGFFEKFWEMDMRIIFKRRKGKCLFIEFCFLWVKGCFMGY